MDTIKTQIENLLQNLNSLPAAERLSAVSGLKQAIESSILTDPDAVRKKAIEVNEGTISVATTKNSSQALRCDVSNIAAAKNARRRDHSLPFQKKTTKTGCKRSTLKRQYHSPVGESLILGCPVCDLKNKNWQQFSHHLFTAHNSSVVSVCRRCHGIFGNRALLLAHECFLWGRKNLPCNAIYSSIQESKTLLNFGFPASGVYFERRCGLCLTSVNVYSTYEQFERHKYEEHADANTRSFYFDPSQKLCFEGPETPHSSRDPRIRTEIRRRTSSPLSMRCLRPPPKSAMPFNSVSLSSESMEPHDEVDAQKISFKTNIGEDGVTRTNNLDVISELDLECSPKKVDADDDSMNSWNTESETDECNSVTPPVKSSAGLNQIVKVFINQSNASTKSTPCNMSKSEDLHICRICKLCFRTQERLQIHEKTSILHEKKSKRKIRKFSQFHNHLPAKNDLAKLFCCEECGLTYARKYSLSKHISSCHLHLASFVCEYCDFRTSDRSAFSQHMARHFQIRKCACQSCDYQAINKKDLQDHVLFKHQDTRGFICDICEKSFKTKGTLSRHTKIHKNISHSCELCNSSFNRRNNLRRHMQLVHSTSKPPRKRGRKLKKSFSRFRVTVSSSSPVEFSTNSLKSGTEVQPVEKTADLDLNARVDLGDFISESAESDACSISDAACKVVSVQSESSLSVNDSSSSRNHDSSDTTVTSISHPSDASHRVGFQCPTAKSEIYVNLFSQDDNCQSVFPALRDCTSPQKDSIGKDESTQDECEFRIENSFETSLASIQYSSLVCAPETKDTTVPIISKHINANSCSRGEYRRPVFPPLCDLLSSQFESTSGSFGKSISSVAQSENVNLWPSFQQCSPFMSSSMDSSWRRSEKIHNNKSNITGDLTPLVRRPTDDSGLDLFSNDINLSRYYILPASDFSGVLHPLNSHLELVSQDLSPSSCGHFHGVRSGTNFSVGYLIGNGCAAVNSSGLCEKSTRMVSSTDTPIFTSSSTSSLLPSLPNSEGLSLLPIANAFDDFYQPQDETDPSGQFLRYSFHPEMNLSS